MLFEVEFNQNDSIVIKGVRKPTRREAEKFCEEYMKQNGYTHVRRVSEISRDEADRFFDLSTLMEWAAFGESARM